MKTDVTLQDLSAKVLERAERKDDLLVPTPDLVMLNGDELSIPTTMDGGLGAPRIELPIEQIAHRQIGERLGIPAKFYESLRTATYDEPLSNGREVPHEAIRQLLDTNVNTLFRERPERRLLRTLKPREDGSGGCLRAFLSDVYRRLDDEEVFEAIVPILLGIEGAEVRSCSLTDTRLYIKVVTPRVTAAVDVDDYVRAGVILRNSEVGHGSLQIKPFVERLICKNGMVVPEAYGEYLITRHVGGRIESDSSRRAFSAETLRLDDEALLAKAREVVEMAVDETNFRALVARMQQTSMTKTFSDVTAGVERLAQRFALGEGESKSVLQHLAEDGDLSQWGAVNAITRTAEDVESYERATELETTGGELLALNTREWEAIAA